MPDRQDEAGRSPGAGDDAGPGENHPSSSGRGAPGGSGPRLGLWHRLLLVLPSARRREEKRSLGERISSAVLKPVDEESKGAAPEGPQSVEDLEHANRYADDTERLIGLVAAPLSAAIALVVTANQIANDPKHTSTYHVLELMFLAMAVLLMAAAWYRKRLYMGILLALIGLGIFNLHYWEFGIPFVLAGAWYLVRAYRAQRALKDALAGGGPATGGRSGGGGAGGPGQSKRYTPPATSKRRPGDKRKAG